MPRVHLGMRFSLGTGLVLTACLGLTACPNEEVTQERETDDTTSSTSGSGPTGDPSAGPTSNGSSDSDPSDSDPTDTTTSDATTDTTTTDATTTDDSGSTSGDSSTGSTGPAGPDFSCAEATLSGPFPIVQNGTIGNGDGDDFAASQACTDGVGGYDRAYQFTAPDAGTYIIGTLGSDFDTVLIAYDECDGMELECDDDIDGQSLITSVFPIVLEADQTILIVVDGYEAADVGDFVLTIEPQAS